VAKRLEETLTLGQGPTDPIAHQAVCKELLAASEHEHTKTCRRPRRRGRRVHKRRSDPKSVRYRHVHARRRRRSLLPSRSPSGEGGFALRSERPPLGQRLLRLGERGATDRPSDRVPTSRRGRRKPMPEIFGPAANSVARVVLLSILNAPFQRLHWICRDAHREASVTRDHPVPFSHEHHVTGLD
jgi:hypothetical protein